VSLGIGDLTYKIWENPIQSIAPRQKKKKKKNRRKQVKETRDFQNISLTWSALPSLLVVILKITSQYFGSMRHQAKYF
jgi:hypothetical protein